MLPAGNSVVNTVTGARRYAEVNDPYLLMDVQGMQDWVDK